jgi:hypothetical protein
MLCAFLPSMPRLLFSSITLLASATVFAADGKLKFNTDIRPILSNSCFQCHGPDEKKREADLRLDTFEGATADLGGYSAIAPGKPDKSALIERIVTHDRDEVMPPPKSKKPAITEQELATLKRWISEGAEYEGHWAFLPLRTTAVPATPGARNGVDAWIGTRLAKEGMKPSREADRPTLIRRLSLDLLGLLPTPEEVAAFVNDARPDAYEKLVDRLLANPHYGERWGRHWLDGSCGRIAIG